MTVGAAIPWLAKAEGTAKAEATDKRDEARQASFRRVVNPYRHLVALALHYASEQPERLVLASPPTGIVDGRGGDLSATWTDPDFIGKAPRALAMLELPPGTSFIPAALELEDGTVVQLFNELASKRQPSRPPTYPGSNAAQAERDTYWEWFAEGFNDRHAVEVVEEAAAQGRITWIAFRVPMSGTTGPFLHLHIAGRGQYETGVFAYNLINRGRKHGMRLVGALKTIASGNLTMVRLLARELQAQTGRRMALPDATATLLLILVRRPELYSRAAAALLARLLDEIPTLTLPDASGLVNVLELIERRDVTVAERNLREVLSPHGQERMVDALRSLPRGSPRAWRWSL